MSIQNPLKRLREIEAGINRKLFYIAGGVTFAAMAMVLLQFFTRGQFPPARIDIFYLGVLVIYSLHKELVRWLGKRKVERQGEVFVYSWIALTTALYIINFLTKDYFSYSAEGESLNTLRETAILTLEVLAVFLLTRTLKIVKAVVIGNSTK